MNRVRIAKIVFVVALAGIPAVYIASRVGYTGTALERTLRDIGFYPIKPPSTLVGPGSIYHVSRDGSFYTTICKADEMAVASVIQQSPSEETVARELQKTKYALDADPVGMVNAKLESDAVESITYSLRNVTLLEIPLDKNEEIFVELTERKSCRDVVDRLLANREFVCQGQSVLIASVEYQLEAKTAAGGSAVTSVDNAPVIKEALAASLDTSVDFDEGRFVSGKGLHYGVKVNPVCVARPTDGGRRLPRNVFDRFVNFVRLDILRR